MLAASEVIGHIYEASYRPDYWPQALESIAQFTHSNSAAILYQDTELKLASGSYIYNISKELFEKYNAYGVDPNFAIIAQNVPLGKAAAIDHILTDRLKLEELYGEIYTNDIMTPDIYHVAGVLLFMDDIRTAGIGLQRTKAMGGWTAEHIDNLNLLVPHIRRALTIQKEFVRLQTREKALKNGLDKLLMGLILFDKNLDPIYLNPVAKSIINYHPALELRKGIVTASEHSNTLKIHSALITAISSSEEIDPVKRCTFFGLKHPNCLSTLPVMISPVEGILENFKIKDGYAHAVMCFSDPDRTYPIEAEMLEVVYGLTSAEANVAVSIANGINLKELAQLNNIKISTVRSQLKAIFPKMGINSQSELVRVLLTGPFGQKI